MPSTALQPERIDVLHLDGLRVGVPGVADESLLVRDVSFSLRRGDRVGIVGESGCGKSLTALSLLGLVPPGLEWSTRRLEVLGSQPGRAGKAAIITQDPMGALNPCFRIRTQLANVLRANTQLGSRSAIRARSIELMELVGMPNPRRVLDAFPHALSGGMRQRVVIAMALAAEPDLLIADEPTTALDVTIQAQIIDLLDGLCREEGLSLILITHDLGVVATLCESVIVMYGGEVVEQSPVARIFAAPIHPYTVGLLESVPHLDTARDRPLGTIEGQVPSDWSTLPGCRFAPRCGEATERCRLVRPVLEDHTDGALGRCWERTMAGYLSTSTALALAERS